MATLKIPYYVVRAGRGYWQPTTEMRRAGAAAVACGQDGPAAWKVASDALAAWRSTKTNSAPPAPKAGTLAAAFAEYRATDEWAKKGERTREEWERAWTKIGPAFGTCRPAAVTLAEISAWRGIVERNVSLREAHRCMKIWRALWQVAAALKYCDKTADPSSGVRNVEPKRRAAAWGFLEAMKLAKTAWRLGYHGLTAVIAVAWDTSFSPVDVRGLTPSQRRGDVFEVERAKTGKAALGTLTRRSLRVLDAYLAELGDAKLHPRVPIFRNRSGAPYSKDTLGDDFRDVREAAFGPKERRTLADFRRSGTIEAMRGGATDRQIGSKLANEFDKSAFLKGTYAPVDLGAVRAADEARKRGRK